MSTRALVVGGTGGIGYAIACRIASDSAAAVTISGRTKPTDIPHANIDFRQLDASSMRSIKQYTDAYKSSQKEKLDVLVVSQGILTTAGRTETAEGIDRKMALHYYGRQLIIRELLPVLKEDAKVLFVLDGLRGNPAHLVWDDLDLKTNFSLGNAASHCISMTDAMIQALAAQNSQNSAKRHFVHAYPGVVKTDLFQTLPWYLRAGSMVLKQIIGVAPEDCAEKLLTGTNKFASEDKEKFWTCIDSNGNVVPNKPTWSEDQIQKVQDHTWKLIDGVISGDAQ